MHKVANSFFPFFLLFLLDTLSIITEKISTNIVDTTLQLD